MTYTLNMPFPKQKFSASQPLILDNFSSINTNFGTDHIPFTAASQLGKHSRVSFIGTAYGIIPNPFDGIVLEAMSSGTRYNLSYKEFNSTDSLGQVQLTTKRVPVTNSNGNSFLPGQTNPISNCMGLIFCWGMMPAADSGINGNESSSIYFDNTGHTAVFEGVPYSIVLTPLRPTGTGTTPEFVSSTTPPTDTKFKIVNTSGTQHDVYWMAIGREKI
jgi:hypothetical protein